MTEVLTRGPVIRAALEGLAPDREDQLAHRIGRELLPMGGAHLSTALFETVIKHTAGIFVIALQISTPIIAVSFVVSVVFGVLNRAVPQMNVFSESFAFRIIGGLTVFGFTLQLTAQHVVNYLNRIPDDLLRIGQLLGGH